MSRICFIGNSHLAAIKLGWQAIAEEYSGAEADFFGAVRDALKDLTVDGRRLVPSTEAVRRSLSLTSGELEAIDLDAYDAFVICGVGYGLMGLSRLYRLYRGDTHKFRVGCRQIVSDACFADAATGVLADTLAMRLASRIADLSPRPVLVSPQPMPSEALLHQAADGVRRWDDFAYWRQLSRWGDDKYMASLFETVGERLSNGSIQVVPQPAQTRTRHIFTLVRYSRGSMKLGLKPGMTHAEDDHFHMNGEYGAAAMSAILAALDVAPARESVPA